MECAGGDGIEMKELMLVPVNENNLHTSTVVIVFDLSKVCGIRNLLICILLFSLKHLLNLLKPLRLSLIHTLKTFCSPWKAEDPRDQKRSDLMQKSVTEQVIPT